MDKIQRVQKGIGLLGNIISICSFYKEMSANVLLGSCVATLNDATLQSIEKENIF